MNIQEIDTIAAISTPLGSSGIGVIRLSGKDALKIADKIFKGKVKLSEAKTFTAHHGFFIDPSTGEKTDEIICLVMRAPRTYTCEDMVEISAHGGVLLLKYLLEKILSCGARHAEPGEFTKRAFINGRIDLTQAEAVHNIINAKTLPGFKNAFLQLQGGINQKIKKIKDNLLENYSLLEAEIDFPEEGNVYYEKAELIKSFKDNEKQIKKMIASYEEGRVIKEGITIAICGKPNVGKSSLLNQLIEKDKAIVSELPGTTRDLIEAEIMLGGILFQLIDTAGIREASNVIEKEGIKRTEKAIKNSDFVILVIDKDDVQNNSLPGLVHYVKNNMKKLKVKRTKEERIFVTLNKVDLLKKKEISMMPEGEMLFVSAKTGEGIDALKDNLRDKINRFDELHTGEVYLSEIRHKSLLEKALKSLIKAGKDLNENLSEEYIVVSVRDCLEYLNELTGESLKEEWLEIIFSKFCIGK